MWRQRHIWVRVAVTFYTVLQFYQWHSYFASGSIISCIFWLLLIFQYIPLLLCEILERFVVDFLCFKRYFRLREEEMWSSRINCYLCVSLMLSVHPTHINILAPPAHPLRCSLSHLILSFDHTDICLLWSIKFYSVLFHSVPCAIRLGQFPEQYRARGGDPFAAAADMTQHNII